MGRNTLVLGITGKIASGKDISSKILTKHYGFKEINVDKIGHNALKYKKKEIIDIFGNEILNIQNKIDRDKLRNIVFKNKKKLLELEKISHPYIYKKIKKELENNNKRVVINSALLFKINLHKFCDYIILIKAKNNIIRERLKKKLSKYEINSIINIQKDIFFNRDILNLKIISIFNNSNYDSLKNKIKNKIKEVISLNDRTK